MNASGLSGIELLGVGNIGVRGEEQRLPLKSTGASKWLGGASGPDCSQLPAFAGWGTRQQVGSRGNVLG